MLLKKDAFTMKRFILLLTLLAILLVGTTVAQEDDYDGPVTEIAIRRLNESQDVDAFAALRDAYVDLLKAQPGANVDREFAPFIDFLSFAPPEPPVFIGMTEYENFEAFGAASGALGETEEATAFFSTFNPEVFAVMRPLNPEDRYDLAELALDSGQVLEVAARDLSSYEDFVMEDYEAARDAYLAGLSEQEGWVAELQWVSLLDPNIVVGMTVYESAEAFQTIATSEFSQSEVANTFVGNYPIISGYASFDARATAESATPTVAADEAVAFPESIAVVDGVAYVSNFFDGSLHSMSLEDGSSEVLVEAGTNDVASGWGLGVDASGLLLACGNRNFVPGPQDNINSAYAVDLASGDVVEAWDLPEGAACNSIAADSNGNIFISDVSPNADIIRIDRESGEVTVWVDEPAWENESGFGNGGLIIDENDIIYMSAGGPLVRIAINEDGSAGEIVSQAFVDTDGNEIPAFSFDGFAYADGSMYGAAFDFATGQSLVVAVTPVDETTVQASVINNAGIGFTGIWADSDTVYAADGQIIQALTVADYVPTTPFLIYTLSR